MEEPRTHTIGKAQLAMMYFPDSDPDIARARLRRAINRNPDLLVAMANSGYNTSSRDFTPRQVRAIYYYLGEP